MVSKPTHSRTKGRVYWKTVYPGCSDCFDFFSFDKSGRYQVDEDKQRQYGINRLRNEIEKLYGVGKITGGRIYDLEKPFGSPEAELHVYEHGVWIK